jgi:WD40 repeat protein
MPGEQDTPLDISWSPDSRWLAVATGAHLLIVNSQSGAIARMYTAPGTSARVPFGGSYLSTTLPKGGSSQGFNAVAWSPNGRWLATSLTLDAPFYTIRVLDAQTGTTAFTLPGGGYGTYSFAWSFDSQYLAGFTLTPPATYKNQVWNIATHQLVTSYPGEGVGGAVWQPGTHRLALVSKDDSLASTLVIWDPLAGKKLRQMPIADENEASGSLAWSPDGRRLVYGIIPSSRQQKAAAVIVNASTGQQLYVYPAGDSHSGALVAWSPDGKYIVSGTGPVYSSAEATPGAQVWIA